MFSGFWGIVPLAARRHDETVDVSVAATLADGSVEVAKLAEVRLVATEIESSLGAGEATAMRPVAGRIAVCMATFNPRLDLFERQVESLRAQTYTDWTCVVSDDHSDPECLEGMTAILGDDARFSLSRSDRRLGFYRNFERALMSASPDASLLALCDQDDRWYPEKLTVLVKALGSADLTYSDQRIVDPSGHILAPSYWTHRRNNFSDLTSLLIANTITGAACLFRRELLDSALPFPLAPGSPYHDHWLALVAMATGKISYVDRPLYDYVQHESAQLGHARANRRAPRPSRLRFRPGWRATYFYDYWRLRVFSLVLLSRCGVALSPAKRRVLERFLSVESSPIAFAWLAARAAWSALDFHETLGVERGLLGAVLWRRIVALSRTARWRALPFLPLDASPPPRPGGRGLF